jgi:hypothetical protein
MHTVTKTINVMDLHEMEGMFVGSLNIEELKLFQTAVDAGKARRSYEDGPGFMGLAKVRLVGKGNA